MASAPSFSRDTVELAQLYDRLSESQFEGGKRLLERMGVARGERVVDVGCGTGRLARWIAGQVGESGIVAGVDPLPERVAIARARGDGIRFEVGRAEDLATFDAESFDTVCMSAVFHWISDRPKALGEARRILRPGGRLGVTTFPQELVMANSLTEVMAATLRAPRYAGQVDASAFATVSAQPTTTELLSMLLASKLDLVELQIVAQSRTHPDGEHVVDFVESSSFGNFLGMVPETLRPTLRRELVEAFDARKGADGVRIHEWEMLFVATRRE